MTPIALGINIGRRLGRGAAAGVVVGPTVQLAGVTSPLSLVHGTTGTFTATPEDINAAGTGASPYWRSSDEDVVRIDDATTGAYTVTGVATDTVTITVNFVAPVVVPDSLAEPNLSTMPGIDMIFSVGNDMGVAPTDTIANMYATAASGGAPRFRPFTADTSLVSLITRPDGTGVGLRAVSNITGYGSWQYVPIGNDLANPNHGPVFNRDATHYIQHRVMIEAADETTKPFVSPYRPKGMEFWHGWNFYRLQFGGTDFRPGSSPHMTHFCAFEFFHIPHESGGQTVGPWFEDMVNEDEMWRFTYQFKSNSLSPGTVNILLQSGDYYFDEDIAVTHGVAENDRIMIPNSAAEWVITNVAASQPYGADGMGGFINRTHATITRQPDLTGNVGTFSIFMSGGHHNVRQTAVFSDSRAGVLTSGAHGGYVTMAGSVLWWEVSDFDGTTACTLTRLQSESDDDSTPLARDYINALYNDTQDGIARMWVCLDSEPIGNGTLIVNVSPDAVGVTLPGGEQAQCARADIATLPVHDNIEYMWFPFPLTQGNNVTWDTFGPFGWGVTGGRGTAP